MTEISAAWQRRIPWLLFFAALALRVGYVFSISDSPLFNLPTMDAGHHVDWAREIAGGDLLGESPWIGGPALAHLSHGHPWFRAPLYPYFLGGMFAAFGENLLLVRLIQAVWGSLVVVMIYYLGRRIFDPLSGLIGAVLAMLTWTFLYFDGELLIESFSLFVNVIVILVFTRVFQKPSPWGYLGCGVLFGIAALTRENAVPLMPVVAAFLVFWYRKDLALAARYAGLFVVGWAIAVSPSPIRNYKVLHEWLPFSFYTGVNFYIGNNPQADGRTAIVPGTRADWWGGVIDVIQIAQQEEGRPLKWADISPHWRSKGLKYALENPVEFAWRIVKKFFYVFDLQETSNNMNMYFFRNQSSVLGSPLFSLFSAYLYIPLGVFGIIAAILKRNERIWPALVFVGGWTIGLAMFFVYTRLRHPMTGFLAMFAGYGAAVLIRSMRENLETFGKYAGGYACVFVLLLSTTASEHGLAAVRLQDGHFTLGNAYMRAAEVRRQAGDEVGARAAFAAARDEFERAEGKGYEKALGEPYGSRVQQGLAHLDFEDGRCAQGAARMMRSLDADERLFENVYGTIQNFDRRKPEAVACPEVAAVLARIGDFYAEGGAFDLAAGAYLQSLVRREDAATYLSYGRVVSIIGSEPPGDYFARGLELAAEQFQAGPCGEKVSSWLREPGEAGGGLELMQVVFQFLQNVEQDRAVIFDCAALADLLKTVGRQLAGQSSMAAAKLAFEGSLALSPSQDVLSDLARLSAMTGIAPAGDSTPIDVKAAAERFRGGACGEKVVAWLVGLQDAAEQTQVANQFLRTVGPERAGLFDCPSLAKLLQNIGDQHATQGAMPPARVAYEGSLALSPSADVYVNYGNVLSIAGGGDADAAYRKAIELNPTLVQPYVNLAYDLEKSGDRAGALAILETGAGAVTAVADQEFLRRRISELRENAPASAPVASQPAAPVK